MSPSRLLIAVGALLVAVATVGWMILTSTDPAEPVTPPAPDMGVATPTPAAEVAQAATALAEQGLTAISLRVKAEMPPEFDDAVPKRKFRGDGVIDMSQDLAAVDYAVGHVPNTAGYFGHVEGDLTVIYESSRFLVTFPVMADVLRGELAWMSYQLSDLSTLKALSLGIGQLREVGLADPRLGVELLASGMGEAADPEGGVRVGLEQAETAVSPDIWRVLQELQELGVDELVIDPALGDDGSLRRFSYALEYPPSGTGPNAKLQIMVRLGRASEEAVQVPSPEKVQSYSEYLGI